MKSFYFLESLLLYLSYIHLVFGQDNCSKSNPCAQGCCSSSGHCGFGPDYCSTGCQGTCDAKAECGQYAPTGKSLCPLNVCCSYYGYVFCFCAATIVVNMI